MNEPYVHVGIVFDPQIEFTLLTPYQQDGRKVDGHQTVTPYQQDGRKVDGHQTVTFDHGRILWQGRLYDELLFEPTLRARGRTDGLVRAARRYHRHQLPLGAQRRPAFSGRPAHHRRKQPPDRRQRHPRGRLPDERHLQRNECHRLVGTAESPCSNFEELAAGPNQQE